MNRLLFNDLQYFLLAFLKASRYYYCMKNSNDSAATAASKNIEERLMYHTAHRDQEGIAKDLADGKEISEVYGLGEAGILDQFFCFIDTLGVSALFEGLDPSSRMKKRDSNVNFNAVIRIYIMRIVSGLAFFQHVEAILLKSQALMHIVGFNGREIRKGTTQRGLSEADKQPEDLGAIDLGKIRGPIGLDSIGTYIEWITASRLEVFFNSVISILAKNGFFPKYIHALMDASQIETTEQCKDCGKVRKDKAPELRRRKARIKTVGTMVYGFKIWVVWDGISKMPLAVRFDKIQVADTDFAKEVVEQAIKNMGKHATITNLSFDRGFIDGKFMHWLDREKIVFYTPAKRSMLVYKDAIAVVDSGIRQTREIKRSVGHGNKKEVKTDFYEVVGLEKLTSAGFYGEPGSGSHENSKNFVPNPINAVVVVNDPFVKNNPNCDPMVILTNGSVKKPLLTYDGYDCRSEIENGLFREAKQAWFIERPARNSEAGVRSHVYLTLIIMALTTAFVTSH